MSSNRLRSNEPATIRNAVHSNRRQASSALKQSGVYTRVETHAVNATAAQVWGDDEDDQVTNIRNPRPQTAQPLGTVISLSPQPVRQAIWQVSMLLRGDELTRLWARNSTALASRLFIWSNHGNSWIPMQELAHINPYVEAMIKQQSPANSTRHADAATAAQAQPGQSAQWAEAERDAALEPVDLTAQAKPEWQSLLWRYVPHASLVLLGVALGTAAAWLGSARGAKQTPVADAADAVAVGLRQNATPLPSEGDSTSSDIIPVSALPLVSAPEVHTAPVHNRPAVKPPASWATAGGHLPFDVARARRTLEGSVWQARHCTPREVEGTVLVTFEPTGKVRDVRISTLSGDMSQTQCIINSFYTASVSPFSGKRVVAKKTFRLNG